MQNSHGSVRVHVSKTVQPQNSKSAMIVQRGRSLFSFISHFLKLANGPAVIFKSEHLDPWCKASGWQRVGVLVFSSFPLLLTTDLDEPSGVGT